VLADKLYIAGKAATQQGVTYAFRVGVATTLRSLVAAEYGAENADYYYDQVMKLNDIATPGLLVEGDTYTLPPEDDGGAQWLTAPARIASRSPSTIRPSRVGPNTRSKRAMVEPADSFSMTRPLSLAAWKLCKKDCADPGRDRWRRASRRLHRRSQGEREGEHDARFRDGARSVDSCRRASERSAGLMASRSSTP
jgi:hypothetical protein